MLQVFLPLLFQKLSLKKNRGHVKYILEQKNGMVETWKATRNDL